MSAGTGRANRADIRVILAALAAGQQTRWRNQDSANRDLRRTLWTSAMCAVELVTVFTAAIAFAVGSLQITLTGTLTFRDRALLLIILGGGRSAGYEAPGPGQLLATSGPFRVIRPQWRGRRRRFRLAP